jgi:hypothetical protein
MRTEIRKVAGFAEPLTFYIGTSAATNHAVLDAAKPADYWFHANTTSSAHVLAVVPDRTPRKQLKYIVKQGALLCKQATAKLAKEPNTPIMFIRAAHVQKTDVPGEVRIMSETSVISV